MTWPFGDLSPASFACIAADPPWYFRSYTGAISDRDPRQHYTVMTLSDLKLLPVSDLAAPDAHLFMWATGPCLPQAFDLITAWGFRYSGIAFTWIKLRRAHEPAQLRMLPTAESDLHLGLGFTTRKNAELCLLARRGNVRRIAKNVREVIMSPVREHSRKPDEFFERVAAYCDGPRVELFARQARDGWSAWGNETSKFARAEDYAGRVTA